jgi:hypothetical protein
MSVDRKTFGAREKLRGASGNEAAKAFETAPLRAKGGSEWNARGAPDLEQVGAAIPSVISHPRRPISAWAFGEEA